MHIDLKIFTNCTDVKSYSVRDSVNNLLFQCPALTFCENRFSYSRAVLWNSLPYDLWQAELLDVFPL